MGGQPDEQLAAAGLGDRHVVLADVHAVGAGGERQVGPVVEPEERAVCVARRAEPLGGGQQLGVGRGRIAQLHHVHAALERGAQQVGGVAASVTK